MNNIFERLLKTLSVRHTKDFTEEFYTTHPNRDNLLGLCQMCEAYGISAKGVKIKEMDINALSIPSILHINNQFAILSEISANKITVDLNGQTTSIPRKEVKNLWDGTALLIESDTDAIEPYYPDHQKQTLKNNTVNAILFIILFTCGLLMLLQAFLHNGTLSIVMALIDIIGTCTCILLLQEQMFQNSKIGDKICCTFNQGSCNEVVSSKGSKVLGYSWGEIGLGYFVSHFSVATLLPNSLVFLSFASWLAMCYSIWSIYYQAYIVRQWCMLCIIVQALLWCTGIACAFLSDLSFITLCQSFLNFHHIGYFFAIASITIFTAKQTSRITEFKTKLWNAKYLYRSLKCKEDIFRHILYQSKFIPTTQKDSSILFGDDNAHIHITVVTNPHCSHCAAMHQKIDHLIGKYGKLISIQYIFWAFNENQEQSNRFLIAAYLQKGRGKALEIFNEWYKCTNFNRKIITNKFSDLNYNHSEIEQELRRQIAWIHKSNLSETPTILVNGYVLPAEYEVEDLALFTNTKL